MACDEEKLIIAPCEWCDEAAEILADVENMRVEDIERQVANGAALFRVQWGKALVGFYVLRVDNLATGCEGVLVAGAGRHPVIDLTATIVPYVEKQFIGCRTMRIHTARPGLIKKLTAMGYAPREFVVGKEL